MMTEVIMVLGMAPENLRNCSEMRTPVLQERKGIRGRPGKVRETLFSDRILSLWHQSAILWDIVV